MAIYKPNDVTTDGKPIYGLSVTGLEGCMAQGDTLGEDIKNLKEVIDEYALSLVEDGIIEPKDLVSINIA